MNYSIRHYWVEQLNRVAFPVIDALSRGRLRAELPLLPAEKKRGVAYLEAFGRTLSGIAPWLVSHPEDDWESNLQQIYIERIKSGLEHCTNPSGPDYFVWQPDQRQSQNQPLVDAAYFISGLLKARSVLWEPLSPYIQDQVLRALQLVSKIRNNPNNNWCMFTARVETGIWQLTGVGDLSKIAASLADQETFYLGDGTYGDGLNFAWDYYNSYVMQPFLEEVTAAVSPLLEADGLGANFRDRVVARMRRYCEVQERLIAPDGTYVVTGRSAAYRTAAFQSIAHLALRHLLPDSLPPGQARNALTKVMNRLLAEESLFDQKGFLRPGVCGHQPALKDPYINTGSLYMFCAVFLPLGLDAYDPFWVSSDQPLTWERAWNGEALSPDFPLEDREGGSI